MGGAVCVSPNGKSFGNAVGVTVKGTLFRMVPEKLLGKQGETAVCG